MRDLQGLGASEENEAPVLLPGPPRIRGSQQSLCGQLAVYLSHMDTTTAALPADPWEQQSACLARAGHLRCLQPLNTSLSPPKWVCRVCFPI